MPRKEVTPTLRGAEDELKRAQALDLLGDQYRVMLGQPADKDVTQELSELAKALTEALKSQNKEPREGTVRIANPQDMVPTKPPTSAAAGASKSTDPIAF